MVKDTDLTVPPSGSVRHRLMDIVAVHAPVLVRDVPLLPWILAGFFLGTVECRASSDGSPLFGVDFHDLIYGMSNVYSAFHLQQVKLAAVDCAATMADTSTTVSSCLVKVDTPDVHQPLAVATTEAGMVPEESHSDSAPHRPWSVVMVGGATMEEVATTGGTSTKDRPGHWRHCCKELCVRKSDAGHVCASVAVLWSAPPMDGLPQDVVMT